MGFVHHYGLVGSYRFLTVERACDLELKHNHSIIFSSLQRKTVDFFLVGLRHIIVCQPPRRLISIRMMAIKFGNMSANVLTGSCIDYDIKK